jgi:hypothetical protein
MEFCKDKKIDNVLEIGANHGHTTNILSYIANKVYAVDHLLENINYIKEVNKAFEFAMHRLVALAFVPNDDPKKTLEEYNKLLAEKNEEFKNAIEKYVEEFEKNGITMSDIYGEKLSDTIKKLQERLKLGIDKARAGVEEEARGMRREVALTEMTRDQHLRLLEIIKKQGISLREGTDSVRPYYEIAKSAYLEGVANALKL